jgi:hypothetical protein
MNKFISALDFTFFLVKRSMQAFSALIIYILQPAYCNFRSSVAVIVVVIVSIPIPQLSSLG